jgi:hypothetical protein
MKPSIWYHTADCQPPKSGYYLTYRGWGIGGKADCDSDHGYLYYHKGQNAWVEYEGAWRSTHFSTCLVYYWTDADPVTWVETDPPVNQRSVKKPNAALEIAWQQVQEAIKRYETVKALSQ